MRSLVVDVGTSGVRAAIVSDDGTISNVRHEVLLPHSPADGVVEIDADGLARTTLDLARTVAGASSAVDCVAVANQRATTVVWEATTGRAVGPALGWQDLRTVGRCLELAAEGIRIAPNQTATKAEWLVGRYDGPTSDLCVGTIDTWILWHLTGGEVFATDATNASVTGLTDLHCTHWDHDVTAALGLSDAKLPAIVDSAAAIGEARAIPGAPAVTTLVGDQQASLVGQGCTEPGDAKITFGSGAMLDLTVGPNRPDMGVRGEQGTFPIVAWRTHQTVWGVEAAMLAAGTHLEWLRDGLALIDSVEQSSDVASACADTGGVVFVPAIMGLGTPHWDFGARGTFLGITRGSGRPELVRAVLEGIAQRAVDLVEAAEHDGGLAIPVLRIDGGMSRNPTFVQLLADASGRSVALSSEREATTVGAGLLAIVGAGGAESVAAATRALPPATVVDPEGPDRRGRWHDAISRASGWIEGLSAIDF